MTFEALNHAMQGFPGLPGVWRLWSWLASLSVSPAQTRDLLRRTRSSASLYPEPSPGSQGREGPVTQLNNMNKMSTHHELTKVSAHLLRLDSTFQNHGSSFACSFLICKLREGGDSEVP